jgi:hypothetical protein
MNVQEPTIHQIARTRFIVDTSEPTVNEIVKTVDVYTKRGHLIRFIIFISPNGTFVCRFPSICPSLRVSESIETCKYFNPSAMTFKQWITAIVDDIWEIEVCTGCRTRYKGRSQHFCLDCSDRPKVIMNSVNCSICQSGFQIIGKYCGGCTAMVCAECEGQYEDRLRCPVCRVHYDLHDPIRTRVNTKRHREEDDDEVEELH